MVDEKGRELRNEGGLMERNPVQHYFKQFKRKDLSLGMELFL